MGAPALLLVARCERASVGQNLADSWQLCMNTHTVPGSAGNFPAESGRTLLQGSRDTDSSGLANEFRFVAD
jgi:hypothetical protein